MDLHLYDPGELSSTSMHAVRIDIPEAELIDLGMLHEYECE